MPSSANTNSKSEKGSSYRPDYDVWNEETGTPTHQDNGDDYYSDSRDNGKNFTRGSSNGNGRDHEERSSSNDAIVNRNAAVSSLRQAENSAASSQEQSYYTGNGRNPRLDNKKAKGNKKKVGALITILLALGGIGTFLGSSNSLLAPALSALTTSATQTNYTSYILRTRFITNGMLKGTGADAVTTGWTGQVKYSKIPQYMRTRLAKNDIEVIGSGADTKLRWNGEDISAGDFVNKYNTNVEFREAYTKAKRGRVATFFDNAANKLYQKLGISRNWRANLRDTGDADTDLKNLNDTLSARFDPDGRTNVRTNTEYDHREGVFDEDGNPVLDKNGVQETVVKTDTDRTDASSSSSGSNDIEAAKGSASSFISKVAGAVASIGSAACTLMKVGNMIAITVAANEIYQSIDYFMGELEGPSKMMAGYGMESGINSQLNILSTKAPSSTTDFKALGLVSMNPGADTSNPPEEQSTGAPIEAPLLLKMLSGANATPEDAANYSLERTIKAMGGAAMFSGKTVAACAGVNIANNIINSVVTISTIFTGGIPSILGSFILKAGIAAATQIAISAALGFLIPTIARALFTNIYDNATGITAGNLIAQGAYASNSRNGRSGSGQSPSDENAILVFNQGTNTVLAMEAEQDRLTHSPFDITNRNTFFGSIAYSLLPTITSTSTTGIASFIRSTASSMSSLIRHGVSAEGENSSYMTTFGDCPLLEEIGVKGDLFCNPIVTTDMELIDLEPTDSKYTETIQKSTENCDADGNCSIKTDSNLARYISYCDNRDSPFGVVDQNILGAMQSDVANNVVLNSIPIVGDIVDIINNATDLKNMDWATGAKCANTAENKDWDEMKYYQRYVEDQRILDQMGAYEDSKNPVLAYEEWYEKEHPTDNSYIGYLSRISGLTPENTETVLAFAIYQNFIDNYDPATRIAMTGHTSDHQDGEAASTEIASNVTLFEDANPVYNPLETNATKYEYIAYYDLRNRSYAA